MANEIRQTVLSGAMLLAAALPLDAYALDGATQSAPSATAPSSGGARSSGGVRNGMGDLKNNRATLHNATGQEAPVPGGATAGAAGSARSPAGQLSQADRLAIRELAQAHLFESKLAGLATAISGNRAVRGYAVKMLEDHLKALDALRGIAGPGGVTLPGGVESSQSAILHALAQKAGTDFDSAYLNEAGTTLQQQEMARVQGLAKSAQSDALKRYALEQTHLAERHLELAGKMKGSPQVAENAIEAARTAGQSVSAAAPPETASNRKDGNSGTPGASSIAGSAVHPGK